MPCFLLHSSSVAHKRDLHPQLGKEFLGNRKGRRANFLTKVYLMPLHHLLHSNKASYICIIRDNDAILKCWLNIESQLWRTFSGINFITNKWTLMLFKYHKTTVLICPLLSIRKCKKFTKVHVHLYFAYIYLHVCCSWGATAVVAKDRTDWFISGPIPHWGRNQVYSGTSALGYLH